jgi:hypothetical protein
MVSREVSVVSKENGLLVLPGSYCYHTVLYVYETWGLTERKE